MSLNKPQEIRDLWSELDSYGALRDSSEKALLKYIKRHSGMEELESLTISQGAFIVDALKMWLVSVEMDLVDDEARRQGLPEPDCSWKSAHVRDQKQKLLCAAKARLEASWTQASL